MPQSTCPKILFVFHCQSCAPDATLSGNSAAMSLHQMIDFLLQRNHSFEKLQRLGDPSVGVCDIILLHGFLGSNFRNHRKFLETWVTSEIEATGLSVTSRVFRFNLGQLLSGPSEAFADEARKLRRHLLHLYEDGDIQDTAVNGNKDLRLADNQAQIPPSPEKEPKSLIFLAHGLGSWIIKDVLASQSSRNIGFMRMGIIHIDCPEYTWSPGYVKLDSHYLPQFFAKFYQSQTMENGRKQERILKLQDSLQTVDVKFQRHIIRYRDQRKKYGFPEKYHDIYQSQLLLWMSDTPCIPETRTPSWGEWLWPHSNSETALPSALKDLRLSDSIALAFRQAMSPVEDSMSQNSDDNDSAASVAARDEYEDPMLNWVNNVPDDPEVIQEDRHEAPEDYISIVSAPKREGITSQNDNLKRVYDLGYSFLQRGDPSNAERLFSWCYNNMPKRQVPNLGYIRVRMQIMAVQMYLGKYQEMQKNLAFIKQMIKISVIEDDPNGKKKQELHRDQRRWSARLLVRTGKWHKAAHKFEKLLEEDPTDEAGKTKRDLALVYAYLGYYDQAYSTIESASIITSTRHAPTSESGVVKVASANSPGTDVNTQKVDATNSKNHGRTKAELVSSMEIVGIEVARAEIHLLSGSYGEALKLSSSALDQTISTLGKEHLKSLFAANIKAWCLAFNAQYAEAESLCLSTLEIITRRLTRKHPYCLEAMRTLAYVFRLQSRFAEAIGTGKALCKLTSTQLGHSHPLTLRSRYQLAAAYLSNGAYKKAAEELEDVKNIAEAQGSLGFFHPESLRYRSELAHALLCCGQLHDAKNRALETAIHQAQVYKYQYPVSGGIEDLRRLVICEREPHKAGNHYQYILKSLRQTSGQSKLPIRLHPFLLSTLRTLATIECSLHRNGAPESELTGVQLLLQTSLEIVVSEPDLASRSSTSIFLRFALAQVLRERGISGDDDFLDQAISHLEKVVEQRRETLSERHLDTLCAYRETMIAYCMRAVLKLRRGEPPDVPVDVVEYRSLEIMNSLESTLGVYHPESLKSRLWCMTITTLNSGNDEAEGDEEKRGAIVDGMFEEARDMISKLRTASVRDERMIESLTMEKTVAGLLLGSGYSGEQLCNIIQDILRATEGAIGMAQYDCVHLELKDMQSSLKKMLKLAQNPE